MKIFFKEKPRAALRVKRRDGFWQKITSRFRKPKPQPLAPLIPDKKIVFRSDKSAKPNFRNRSLNAAKFKNVGFALLAMLVVIALAYLITSLVSLPGLRVTKFTILGNRSISDEKLLQVLDKFRGLNILTINQNQVDRQLHSSFSALKDVQIRKIYPDRMFVIITEREPKLILINLTGAYLIDENAQILQPLKTQQIIFSTERLQIAQGLGDPNSALVEERLRADFITRRGIDKLEPEVQQTVIASEFDFAKISLNDKQKTLNAIEHEAVSEIERIINDYNAAIDNPDYTDLPRVFAYENKNYQLNENIDKHRLELTDEALSFLIKKQKLTITKIVWEGQLLVNIESDKSKKYVFGTNRSTTLQLEDLLLVEQQLTKQNKDYTKIDVSSQKISVI